MGTEAIGLAALAYKPVRPAQMDRCAVAAVAVARPGQKIQAAPAALAVAGFAA